MPRVILLAIMLLSATAASAATRHLSVAGAELAINSPCARQVTIDPDAISPGQITVDAVADHQEELDQLVLTGGRGPKLTVPDQCWRPTFNPLFQRTLALTLHVPPGAPLAIEDSGAPDYHIGAVGGPLTLEASGAAHVTAAAVTSLTMQLSGSGDVTVASVTGPLKVEISGAGDLDIARVTAPAANLEISGAGDIHLGAGSVGKLTVSGSGMAKVRIDSTVTDATVELSGAGSVNIAKLTGGLTKDISGMGTVVVDGR
jgi:hypothetical protein